MSHEQKPIIDPEDWAQLQMAREVRAAARVEVLEEAQAAGVSSVILHSTSRPKKISFWTMQPVMQPNEQINLSGAIEPDKPAEEIKQHAYILPKGFMWDTLDLKLEEDLQELHTLLSVNYMATTKGLFRYHFRSTFLQWSLMPPGWRRDWHLCVRVSSSRVLMGFISAIPQTLCIDGMHVKSARVGFLCVHKNLQGRRMAPVLMLELKRRVQLAGVFQGNWASFLSVAQPLISSHCWHRQLNPKKMSEVGFSECTSRMTLRRTEKLLALPAETQTKGFQPIATKDMDKAHRLLKKHLSKFRLSVSFSKEEFLHWFTPREHVLDVFVVKTPKGAITDLVSYYHVENIVLNHPEHKIVRSVYCFYSVAKMTGAEQLLMDALITAKNAGMDVFNALDIMDNKAFLSQLRFSTSAGKLHYYLYNWKCPHIKPEGIAVLYCT